MTSYHYLGGVLWTIGWAMGVTGVLTLFLILWLRIKGYNEGDDEG